MSREPSYAEMNTPVEMSDLPHDVLVSVNQHMSEAMGRSIANDLAGGVRQMTSMAEAIEALRCIVEFSPLAHTHLTNAGIALGNARDELRAYAKLYAVK